jgi:hypothetical protein
LEGIEAENGRIIAFIRKTIQKYRLDFTGLTIYTEAASGCYLYTPIAAAIAGAKRVYALARDSRYGTKEEIRDRMLAEAARIGIEGIIDVVFEKKSENLAECDILTNCGFVRPIDRETVSALKGTAVIPLMWEVWEFRKDEFDLKACRERGITVMGTNEHHPDLDLFRTIGFKVCKLLFAAGLSVYDDKLLLVSSGDYGKSIADFLRNNGVDFDRIELGEGEDRNIRGCLDRLGEYDAMIVAELNHDIEIIGENGVIPAALIGERNPLLKVVYICGVVDSDSVQRRDIDQFPRNTCDFGHIAVTADYLGWKPVIELNIAGLKVGEAMARARLDGLSPHKSIKHALASSPADAFAEDLE